MRLAIFIIAMAWAGMQSSFCQDLARTKALVEQKRWPEARKSIDQTLARPDMKGRAEAWYLKARICSAMATDSTSTKSMGDAGSQSLQALNRALSIDRETTEALLAKDRYRPLYDLYSSGFQRGKAQYEKGSFREAYQAFEETGRVGEFIHGQGWGLHAFDTTLVLWKALSADHIGRKEEALKEFTSLADAGVGGNPDFAVVYRWLAKNAYERGDMLDFNRYHQAGIERYPNDGYLQLLMLDRLLDEGDPDRILPMYERLLKTNPDSYDLTFQYANELFDAAHVHDRTERDRAFGVFTVDDTGTSAYAETVYEAKCKRIEALYARCLEWKPESMEPFKRLGRHHYNEALILDSSKRSRAWTDTGIKRLQARILLARKKAVRNLEVTMERFDKGIWRYSDAEEYKSVLKMLAYCHMGIDARRSDMYLARLEEFEKTGPPRVPSGTSPARNAGRQ
jgi:tetratricopeptide (TPR) repeat protein